jgi:hypothetical protein
MKYINLKSCIIDDIMGDKKEYYEYVTPEDQEEEKVKFSIGDKHSKNYSKQLSEEDTNDVMMNDYSPLKEQHNLTTMRSNPTQSIKPTKQILKQNSYPPQQVSSPIKIMRTPLKTSSTLSQVVTKANDQRSFN